jgi:glycosyltransferase involved in cell wall biosynthesis
MKILHINTNPTGGAAIAAIRIHKAMLKEGIDSNILFLKSNTLEIPQSFRFEESCSLFKIKNFYNRVRHFIYSKFDKTIPISLAFNVFDICNHPAVQEADIIHLHWVSKFIDFSFFKKFNKPVVWTLHDMAPFTGGNHYITNFDVKKYASISESNLKYKINALKNIEKIGIVTPSAWLGKVSRNSELFCKFSHFVVRNTIVLNIFKPLEKNEIRAKYNFNHTDKIVIFVAENINDQRKGVHFFIKIVNELIESNVKIILIGNGKLDICSVNITEFGNIADERKLVELYNLADVFVITSIEDNFPNTIVEAMACGTPVVGFDNSGIGEIIVHKKNGYLAANKDEKDLFDGIQFVFKNKEILSLNARQKVLDECSENGVVEDYVRIYKQLTN